MANAKIKTVPTRVSVTKFISQVGDAQRRKDSREVLEMMKRITGLQPVMWGPAIIGFGKYHYRYESGREGDMPVAAFSPRKQNLTIYLDTGFTRETALMKKLGKYKTGKVCLYISKLSDVDTGILESLIRKSFEKVSS